jgi:hypothetical protein
MESTEGDFRLLRAVVAVARYVILPVAVLGLLAKLTGLVDWSWWIVLTPWLLYALHPIVIGASAVVLQDRRRRRRNGDA